MITGEIKKMVASLSDEKLDMNDYDMKLKRKYAKIGCAAGL